MERPKLRLCYKHVTGTYYAVHGFATHMKTKVEIVIVSSLTDGTVEFIELANFFDKHPTTSVPRFELVMP